jgi:hypothetical protein
MGSLEFGGGEETSEGAYGVVNLHSPLMMLFASGEVRGRGVWVIASGSHSWCSGWLLFSVTDDNGGRGSMDAGGGFPAELQKQKQEAAPSSNSLSRR